jgi:SPX domain protein involved in polyphosphate accumulation
MIRRFNRYEFKYVVPLRACEGFMRELEERLPKDTHGGADGYRILSLYYDSPALDCFWAKIEGLKFRRKVRLRTYDGSDLSKLTTGLVEIKQRINRTVQKRRLALPLAQAEKLCAGGEVPEDLDPLDKQVAHEVSYMALAMHLRPAAITTYWRKAYEGTLANAGLRVTFDTDVRGRIHALELAATAKNHLVLPLDWCVMEVKANETVPDWMLSLLARHNFSLNRISKYCAVVSKLHGLDVAPLTSGGSHPELLPEPIETEEQTASTQERVSPVPGNDSAR